MPTGIYPRPSLEDRFWNKVEKTNNCWNWLGYKNNKGYGFFNYNGKPTLTHHFAYESVNGKIPEGKQIDHLCRNHTCVKPAHLEAGTSRENCRRGLVGLVSGAQHLVQIYCNRGHEFTPENTHIDKKGKRNYRACKRELNRNWLKEHRPI